MGSWQRPCGRPHLASPVGFLWPHPLVYLRWPTSELNESDSPTQNPSASQDGAHGSGTGLGRRAQWGSFETHKCTLSTRDWAVRDAWLLKLEIGCVVFLWSALLTG